MHVKSSVGWLTATLAADHLRVQAKLIITSNSGNDEEFALIISYAIKYWGVETAKLGDKFGAHPSTVNRWSRGKSAPIAYIRPMIFTWIAEDLERRADEIQKSLE